jgi:hypothetical protein
VTIRQFGTLKNAVAAFAASVSATGNNFTVEGDNMRRWVVARLVIDDERPGRGRADHRAGVLGSQGTKKAARARLVREMVAAGPRGPRVA